MKKQFYFLSPIEVVRVTNQNLEEVAEWCGGTVASTESKRVAGRVDKYVWVPTPKGTSLSWAFPGMFVTKRLVVTLEDELRETFAVFRRNYFEKNYFDTPLEATDLTWERQLREKAKGRHPAGKKREHGVGSVAIVDIDSAHPEIRDIYIQAVEQVAFETAGSNDIVIAPEVIDGRG